MELEWADQLENMDRKPGAKIDPIKTSHLGKDFVNQKVNYQLI